MDPIMIILRLVIPLLIFRFPLIGGLASIILDGADWHVNVFHISNLHAGYTQTDKILDLYYLSIEAFVILRWKNMLAKNVALALYVWRMVGLISFISIGTSWLLVLFPNIFEVFFLFYVSTWAILKRESRTSAQLLLFVLITMAIPKIYQEYIMHIRENSDWRYVYIPGLHFSLDMIVIQVVIGAMLVAATIFIQRRRRS